MSEEDCLTRYREILLSWNTDDEITESLFRELVAAYSNKKRFYHNMDHLKDLLKFSNEYAGSLKNKDLVDLSIFYHDIVYRPTRHDNEERSAQQAEKILKSLRASKTHIDTVGSYIRATQQHTSDSTDTDLDYLLDFDLAILGAEKTVYDRYTEAIRKEYRVFPDFMYKPGRRKALTHFLERGKIFKTPPFNDRFEAAARRNIEQEVYSLST